jgi:hypothetical protein
VKRFAQVGLSQCSYWRASAYVGGPNLLTWYGIYQQVKLDELIRALKLADNKLLGVEDLTEQDLQLLHDHYAHLAHLSQSRLPQKKKAET